MVNSAYGKDFFREIRRTFNRFLSITLLLLLAAGFFSGIRATQPDMQISADRYMDETALFDLRVVSTQGVTAADAEILGDLDGVNRAVPGYSLDAVVAAGEDTAIVKLHDLSETMNVPELVSGRLPLTVGECAAEQALLTALDLQVGDTVTVAQLAEGMEGALKTDTLTITGVVRSPLYMTKISHGTSALGSGSVAAFVILPPETFDLDYFTDLYLSVDGAAALMAYDDAYGDRIGPVQTAVEDLAPAREQARYEELTAPAREEIDRAQEELDDAGEKLADGQAELDRAKQDYADGVSALEQARQDLADARAAYDQNYDNAYYELEQARLTLVSRQAQLDDGRAALEQGRGELEAQAAQGRAQLDETAAQLSQQAEQLAAGQAAYETALAQYAAQQAQWDALPPEQQSALPETEQLLQQTRAQLEATAAELTAGRTQLQQAQTALDTARQQLETTLAAGQAELEANAAALDSAAQALADGWSEYYNGLDRADRDFAEARQQLEGAQQEIEQGEQTLQDAALEIADGENELAENRRTVQDAQAELDDARDRLAEVEPGTWYVLDRNSNTGFVSYRQDSERMGAIGNVFPVLFFAVACLVCLTCMTRMVDEKRVELGTYKALGFGGMKTAVKLVGYSALAAVIGIAAGIALGMNLLPRFIFHAYTVLYDIPVLYTPLHGGIVAASAAAGLLCSVGATLVSTLSTLRETPASLLRPKAPAPGKRVILERITPLWRRMSFFGKVSARNLLRYQKRFWMTLVGIAGCTALIVTGFGLRDSIRNITALQFEQIQKYDLQAYFLDEATPEDVSAVADALANDGSVARYALVRQTGVDLESPAGVQSGYCFVPMEPAQVDDFITFRHRTDGTPVTLPERGAVITEKLAELLRLHVGDTLTVVLDGIRYQVDITDITENYTYHYVYMTPAYYREVFGEEAAPNQALITDTDPGEATANAVSERLLGLRAVNYTTYFQSVADYFSKALRSVDAVVVIIIVAAAALAFVVLYNLTSINITERVKELATLKVLGFRDREVTEYIVRENTVLTLLSIAVGLVGGRFLHGWLVRTVEVDICMFGRSAKPVSYVLAAVLTVLFAALVNGIGHRTMKSISMVESLKSNE